MAIFTSLAIAEFLGVEAGFFTAAAAFVANAAVGIVASMGISLVAKALSGTATTPATTNSFGTQGVIAAAGDVPRAFGLGYLHHRGFIGLRQLLGHDQAPGVNTTTPNAYLTQVIALGDLPGEKLLGILGRWRTGQRSAPPIVRRNSALSSPNTPKPARIISGSSFTTVRKHQPIRCASTMPRRPIDRMPPAGSGPGSVTRW